MSTGAIAVGTSFPRPVIQRIAREERSGRASAPGCRISFRRIPVECVGTWSQASKNAALRLSNFKRRG